VTDIIESTNAIGRPIRRKEDAKLLHGRTNWTDNIQLPGTLHMAIVRSPMAHAKIAKIDLSGALAMPNVVAAFDAASLGDLNAGVPCVWPVTDNTIMPPFPALTGDKVRHVGDCVAVVLATDAASAEDALAAVDVEYEPLPAVVNMVDATSPGTELVHESVPNNSCYTYPFGGGFDEVAAKADRVVKRRFVNQRLIPAFMEPRAVVAAPMGMSDEITVWSATQIPHVLRVLLTLVTGIPEQNLRVVAPDVGGGFGGKLQCYREEILVV
jgi:carbon-monoxide dehydrogenase large subunit